MRRQISKAWLAKLPSLTLGKPIHIKTSLIHVSLRGRLFRQEDRADVTRNSQVRKVLHFNSSFVVSDVLRQIVDAIPGITVPKRGFKKVSDPSMRSLKGHSQLHK